MVEWAPMDTPIGRRRQTCAVLAWSLIQPFCFVLSISLLFFPPFWIFTPLFCVYLGWFIVVDRKTPSQGGRKMQWFRRLFWWRMFRDYFPIRLVKTADLDPSKNYVFGYHPHGIIGIGAVCNFGTEATKFEDKFPGIDLHLLTLKTNFNFPIFREYLMALGICDVSKESCNHILQSGPGSSICIVIGGAAEALDAHPGTFDLTLKNRKGFVKVALQNGASLVPVFSFGENEVFEQAANPRGSKLRNWQTKLQKVLGFSMPLVRGRGVFQYNYGLMPFRRPITSVVGTPIDCPKVAKPTQEQIDLYHEKYCKTLTHIYDKHKNVLAMQRKKSMKIM